MRRIDYAEMKKDRLRFMYFMLGLAITAATVVIFAMCFFTAVEVREKDKKIADLEQQNALVPPVLLDDFATFDTPKTLLWTEFDENMNVVEKSYTSKHFNREKVYNIGYKTFPFDIYISKFKLQVDYERAFEKCDVFDITKVKQRLSRNPYYCKATDIYYFFDAKCLKVLHSFELFDQDFVLLFLGSVCILGFLLLLFAGLFENKEKQEQKFVSVEPVIGEPYKWRVEHKNPSEHAIAVEWKYDKSVDPYRTKEIVEKTISGNKIPRRIKYFTVKKGSRRVVVSAELKTDADVILATTMCRGMNRLEPLEKQLWKYRDDIYGHWVQIQLKTGFRVFQHI